MTPRLEDLTEGFQLHPGRTDALIVPDADGCALALVVISELTQRKPGSFYLEELQALVPGGGRRAMQVILDRADRIGATLYLVPEPLIPMSAGHKLSERRLRSWYRGLGFSAVRGSQQEMVRRSQRGNPARKARLAARGTTESLVRELEDLSARNELLSAKVDALYEAGEEDAAALLEEDIEAVIRRMEDIESELEESGDYDALAEGEAGGVDIEASAGLEEQLIARYGDLVRMRSGDRSGSFVDVEGIVANMRSAIETAAFGQGGLRRPLADEEIVGVARELWEERQKLKGRYLRR